MLLAKQGKGDEALPLLSEAVLQDPNQPGAWGYRGNVHAVQGRLQEAEADFLRALQLSPNDAAATQGMRYVKQRRALPPAAQ
jgi:Flp pilus assembly protein TadD